MTIKTKLLAGYLVISLLIVAVAGVAVYGFTKTQSEYDTILSQNTPVMVALREIQYYFTGQANDERGFLLTGGDEFKGEITQKADQITKRLQFIQPLVATDEEKQLLQDITLSHQRFTQINYQVISLYKEGKFDEAKALSFGEGRTTRKALETSFNSLVKISQEKSKNTAAHVQTLVMRMETVIVGAGTVAVLLGIGIGLFMAVYITKPIKRITAHIVSGDLNFQEVMGNSQDEIGQLVGGFAQMVNDLKQMVLTIKANAEQIAAASEELTGSAEQTAHVSGQIAASVTNVAYGTEQQLSAVNESTAITGQVSCTIEEMKQNSQVVSEMSGRMLTAAKRGDREIISAVEQMKSIEEKVMDTVAVVGKLSERAQDIGSFVATIAAIAGQTNLLALNAAIEAARAGEHGRGFAVVADEVRKLAEESREATQEITVLINEIRGETEQAVAVMGQGRLETQKGSESIRVAGQTFHNMLELINQVTVQIQKVDTSIGQVAVNSQNITGSINNIGRISQETAAEAQTVSAATQEQSAAMEEIVSASHSLADMAQNLQMAVAKFQM
ncbi:hypothetical protein P22_1298 [Propionispora sp. 2/2-37]|uniref:methyl-accepting chemotaxis protein n=1 Tax=Propionispora sp. 2/2-37 TaxID=1677858 RepID=UPI0006BB6FD4|nr:methyl-accepting chemotaxis protein [Propionispora sp. 2/2-37]CUH95228.1 hypothetical protein P22_1298 [Propionispora sp. 2/2-37]